MPTATQVGTDRTMIQTQFCLTPKRKYFLLYDTPNPTSSVGAECILVCHYLICKKEGEKKHRRKLDIVYKLLTNHVVQIMHCCTLIPFCLLNACDSH